jgi:exopolyphosphatase/guanosine-5'-triphosphate,3'-diphosphate pyrophosphatase
MTSGTQEPSLFAADTEAAPPPPRQVAVIDIGTSAIRLAIGEIRSDGSIRTLDTLTQPVALGKDTFSQTRLSRATIESSVRVLRSYREVLGSYGIADQDVRCVATSAVREAQNRLAFRDRIYIATGFQVEALDTAEVSRVTFLGVQPTLQADPELNLARAVVVEVGGGSTEVLVVENGQVAFSHTYNLGSLRLRQTLESLRTPVQKEREIMHSQIDRFLDPALQHIDTGDSVAVKLIALGADFRFVARHLAEELVDNSGESLVGVQLERFRAFTDEVLTLSTDELVQRFRISYPDAETLGPALLTMLRFADRLGVTRIRVSPVNLRDGLMQEMASQGVWSDNFRQQIMNSAVELGRKYVCDEAHAKHVAGLSSILFDALQSHHRLDARHRTTLELAALLHEIGLFVGISSYHKHSQYLILNSELFGLSRRELMIVALVARYHRRASPKPTHSPFSTLDREERVLVCKLASMLRVAIALDRSYSQRIREFTCSVEKGRLVVSIPGVEDLSLEQIMLRQTGQMFEETFGMSVLLRRSRL